MLRTNYSPTLSLGASSQSLRRDGTVSTYLAEAVSLALVLRSFAPLAQRLPLMALREEIEQRSALVKSFAQTRDAMLEAMRHYNI